MHEMHRVNTVLKDILRNALEYNKAWWRSAWQFILFKENEHQVIIAEKLSKKMGFEKFYSIHSREFSDSLHPASWYEVAKHIEKNTVLCKYKERRELYINAQGQVLPCCWLSGIETKEASLIDENMNIKHHTFEEVFSSSTWIEKIGKFMNWEDENICMKKCWIE